MFAVCEAGCGNEACAHGTDASDAEFTSRTTFSPRPSASNSEETGNLKQWGNVAVQKMHMMGPSLSPDPPAKVETPGNVEKPTASIGLMSNASHSALAVIEESIFETIEDVDQNRKVKTIVSKDPDCKNMSASCESTSPKYNFRREHAKAIAAVVLVYGVLIAFGATLVWKDQTSDQECPSTEDPPLCCKPCGEGTLVFPLGGEWERGAHRGVQAIVYLIGLLWFFLGMGIVCDEFVAAIEKITNKQKVVWHQAQQGIKYRMDAPVWNATVANLTLMALGSSAPEIMLATIEMLSNQLFTGKLGPSTVVGSAAFNLFVISAVCVGAIPPGEIRKIEAIEVFAVTSSMSILAYFWVWIVLQVHSPDKIDVWEGVATLLWFPVFITMAFGADKWYQRKLAGIAAKANEDGGRLSQNGALEVSSNQIGSISAPSLGAKSAPPAKTPRSRAQLRKAFTSGLTGGRRVRDGLTIGFEHRNHVIQSDEMALLRVVANRAPRVDVVLNFRTVDGKAKAGLHYEAREGSLKFTKQRYAHVIQIPIIRQHGWDVSEEFYVQLSEPSADVEWLAADLQKADLQRQTSGGESIYSRMSSKGSAEAPRLGVARATVRIVDELDLGTLSFEAMEVLVDPDYTRVPLKVLRHDGKSGTINCSYQTCPGTASPGQDYEHVQGTLEFGEGDTLRNLLILCEARRSPEDRYFEVRLQALDHHSPMESICKIILAGSGRSSRSSRQDVCTQSSEDTASEWHDKVTEAFYCNGSLREQVRAGVMDWASHILALFWKALFLLVPPPSLAGGWPSFICALGMIGMLTFFVKELADLLGCAIGMDSEITAITLVALGTSLPDTFASRTAAVQDSNADAAIGNVTGSNAVNVFLGLGLPWSIGAIYWQLTGVTDQWKSWKYAGKTYEELFLATYPDGGLMQPAGGLAFSVFVFTGGAVGCVALLELRRCRYGGELGGPQSARWRDSMILGLLWLGFVTAYIWKVETTDE